MAEHGRRLNHADGSYFEFKIIQLKWAFGATCHPSPLLLSISSQPWMTISHLLSPQSSNSSSCSILKYQLTSLPLWKIVQLREFPHSPSPIYIYSHTLCLLSVMMSICAPKIALFSCAHDPIPCNLVRISLLRFSPLDWINPINIQTCYSVSS